MINKVLNIYLGTFPAPYFPETGGTKSAKSMLVGLVSKLTGIIVSIGILLLLWGLGEFFLSLMDENASNKTPAIMKICIGVTLIGINGIIEVFKLT